MKDKLLNYLNNDSHSTWPVGLLPGLYSLLYLYTNNFTLVNSWHQVFWFLIYFIVFPLIAILSLDAGFKRWLPRYRFHLHWSFLIISFVSIFSLCLWLGWRWKGLLLIGGAVILSSFYMARHYKKLLLFLSIMTLIALFNFAYFYLARIVDYEDWTTHQVYEDYKFISKPNIYIIQPDGFVSKPTASNSLYRWDGLVFYENLDSIGFARNDSYRSNYSTTLSSNAALFTSQHHYYDQGRLNGELFNARDIIMGNNAALRTLKSNGYTLNAILEHKYLLLNHPQIAYDRINITRDELGVLPNYQADKNYIDDLEKSITMGRNEPQFYFIEILKPGHITVDQSNALSKEKERDRYLMRMKEMGKTIVELTATISNKDPDAIIIILADHGGFVGFKSTDQAYSSTTQNEELKQSLFGSLLAVKGPTPFLPYFENIKSSVGIFPHLFSFLSNRPVPNESIDDSSYIFIKEGAKTGVFRYYDTNGNAMTQPYLKDLD